MRGVENPMATENSTPELMASTVPRRVFVGGAAAAVGAVLVSGGSAEAREIENLAASPPPNFVPLSMPGRVIKVKKPGSLMPNGLYPKEADAREMLRRALEELTGKRTLPEALALFVHKDDRVCLKLNGIGSKSMSTNKELVLPVAEALIAGGHAPESITILEQWGGYMQNTRVDAKVIPPGVRISIHGNHDVATGYRDIPGTGQRTKFVRGLTESTAVINFALVKDHSICGYTGCLKNMTHGCIINPEEFHSHHASPQIAILAAQEAIKSRVRLNITDGFKVMAHGGPLWKQPRYVVPHEAVYVSTDMVAMDRVGWEVVEQERAKFNLRTLTADGRIPGYIRAAGDLGLGIADRDRIRLREIAI
jgi:uncharacterized protein (DUF362 family)